MSAEMKMLERLFEAEIEGRLFQSKAAMLKRLEAHGLVTQVVETIAPDKQCPWPITCNGWALTHAGRIKYCSSKKSLGNTRG